MTCPTCKGSGKGIVQNWGISFEATCEECQGTGAVDLDANEIARLRQQIKRLTDIEHNARNVVEHFTRWLAYKSDQGYFDDHEMDLSWEGEEFLSALETSLTRG